MESEDKFGDSFLRLLAQDALEALDRVDSDDRPSVRREAIRTIFSVIEGIVWYYKDHIVDVADSLDALDDITRLAFNGLSYTVSENGKLTQQQRFFPLTSMIRLTTNVAIKMSGKWSPDFTEAGWSHLKQSIIVRNRVTHPKSMSDMDVAIKELKVAEDALFWLLILVVEGMSATHLELESHNTAFKEYAALLIAGDPKAIAIYRAHLLQS